MADAIILNVNAQDLINTAEEFRSSGSTVSGITDEMMSLITGISSSWTGDASEAYINKFRALDDDILKLVGMINEHVNDLEQMAETYTEGENENLDSIQMLSDDVII